MLACAPERHEEEARKETEEAGVAWDEGGLNKGEDEPSRAATLPHAAARNMVTGGKKEKEKLDRRVLTALHGIVSRRLQLPHQENPTLVSLTG